MRARGPPPPPNERTNLRTERENSALSLPLVCVVVPSPPLSSACQRTSLGSALQLCRIASAPANVHDYKFSVTEIRSTAAAGPARPGPERYPGLRARGGAAALSRLRHSPIITGGLLATGPPAAAREGGACLARGQASAAQTDWPRSKARPVPRLSET